MSTRALIGRAIAAGVEPTVAADRVVRLNVPGTKTRLALTTSAGTLNANGLYYKDRVPEWDVWDRSRPTREGPRGTYAYHKTRGEVLVSIKHRTPSGEWDLRPVPGVGERFWGGHQESYVLTLMCDMRRDGPDYETPFRTSVPKHVEYQMDGDGFTLSISTRKPLNERLASARAQLDAWLATKRRDAQGRPKLYFYEDFGVVFTPTPNVEPVLEILARGSSPDAQGLYSAVLRRPLGHFAPLPTDLYRQDCVSPEAFVYTGKRDCVIRQLVREVHVRSNRDRHARPYFTYEGLRCDFDEIAKGEDWETDGPDAAMINALCAKHGLPVFVVHGRVCIWHQRGDPDKPAVKYAICGDHFVMYRSDAPNFHLLTHGLLPQTVKPACFRGGYDPADGESFEPPLRRMRPFSPEALEGDTSRLYATDAGATIRALEALRPRVGYRTALDKDGFSVKSIAVYLPNAKFRVKIVPEEYEALQDVLELLGNPFEYTGQSPGLLAVQYLHAALARNRVPVTARQRSLLENRQHNRCAQCGDALSHAYAVDHRQPLRADGSNDFANLQLLCPPCHRDKTSQEQECLTTLRVVESCVNLEALEAFVKASKPKQLVFGTEAAKPCFNVDGNNTRPTGIYLQRSIPSFSVLDDVVEYDGRPFGEFDYLWVRIRTAQDPDAPPPRARGRLPVYTSWELLPYDGWRRYHYFEVRRMQKRGFLGPEHVTHTYTAKARVSTQDCKDADSRFYEAFRQVLGARAAKNARLAGVGICNNNEPYSLRSYESNCEEETPFRKRWDKATGMWHVLSRQDVLTAKTMLSYGYPALAYEQDLVLGILDHCKALGLEYGKDWFSCRNDGVTIATAHAREVAALVNEEFGFEAVSVKPVEKALPLNAWTPRCSHCPPRLLPAEWKQVLVDDTGVYEPFVDAVLRNEGGLVVGLPGVGKTHFANLLRARLGDRVATTAYQICTARRIGGASLYNVLRRPGSFEWLIVDEYSQLPTSVYAELVVQKLAGKKLVFLGDSAQLPAVNDRYADALPHNGMEDTRCVRGLVNDLKIRFRHNFRCADFPEHFEYIKSVHDDIDGPYAPDCDRFPANELPDIFVTQCHHTRLRVNEVMNSLQKPDDAVFFPKPERCHSNMQPQDMYVWPGLKMVGARGSRKIVNGLTYDVQSVGADVTLKAEDGEILVVDRELFVKCLRLAYAVTCHCVQGLTITDERVWFLDAHSPYTTKRHYLVAISRVRDPRNLGIPTREQQRRFLARSAPRA
jgi:hypothetical protein